MSRKSFVLAITLQLLAAAPAFAQSNRLSSNCWNNFWTCWHRNNCWMEPFIYPDRASVANMFELQIAKGWQMQCLLGDPHFDADSTRLSPAGLIKVRWILNQNPAQYRNLFVERGLNDEITQKRIATVTKAASEFSSRGPFPEVLASDMALVGSSAEQVNSTNTWLTAYERGIPPIQPKAFTNTDVGTGSSGGQ